MSLQFYPTQPDSGQTVRGRTISRRDWMVLPLVGILSIVIAGGVLEVVARTVYNESPWAKDCLDVNPVTTMVRGKSNSVCVEKMRESNWVEYRFNDRGHRSDTPYKSKQPGTYRIVLIGSSLAEGWTVPLKQSYASLLPAMLSRDAKKKVEVYDEGIESGSALNTYLRFNEGLAAEPDLILWAVTPWDVLNSKPVRSVVTSGAMQHGSAASKSKASQLWVKLTRKRDFVGALSGHLTSFFMLQHLLYESRSIYLAHSITGRDEYTPSLEMTPSGIWKDKLALLDGYIAGMEEQAKAAGVPFVVMALPRHAQAVMIASQSWPPGLNPYSFGDQVKAIVEKHGGVYIDVLHDFKNLPDIHAGFYPVDQHLNARGQAMFASVIEKGLTSGEVPALTAASPNAY